MVMTIYIIDDEPSIRDTFKWHLEDLGHEVIAMSAPEHCTVYHSGKCSCADPCCDALLIDYQMPRLNGLEFLQSMFAGGCSGNPANVILMSGDTSKIDMAVVKKLGCRVVQKPISLSLLEGWVSEVELRGKAATEGA